MQKFPLPTTNLAEQPPYALFAEEVHFTSLHNILRCIIKERINTLRAASIKGFSAPLRSVYRERGRPYRYEVIFFRQYGILTIKYEFVPGARNLSAADYPTSWACAMLMAEVTQTVGWIGRVAFYQSQVGGNELGDTWTIDQPCLKLTFRPIPVAQSASRSLAA